MSLWAGVAVFVVGTVTAAFAPWRRVATGALIVVLTYSLFQMDRSAAALAKVGGWSLVTGG